MEGIYGRGYMVENIYRGMILRVGNIWEGTNGWWGGDSEEYISRGHKKEGDAYMRKINREQVCGRDI